MRRVVFPDTGILGMMTKPERYPEIREWLIDLCRAGFDVVIPEISDYELRRELIRKKITPRPTHPDGPSIAAERIDRLDKLQQVVEYQPISTEAMRQAATFWADARNGSNGSNGSNQTAPDAALDGDVILAAQAKVLADKGCQVTVVTHNIGHLSRYGVDAKEWQQVLAANQVQPV